MKEFLEKLDIEFKWSNAIMATLVCMSIGFLIASLGLFIAYRNGWYLLLMVPAVLSVSLLAGIQD